MLNIHALILDNFCAERIIRRMQRGGEHSSLAVLPLVLLGKAADDHGLCLGFADALVSRLGNLQGVDVLPTSSVFNLPLEVTASDIASRLGVRFVVHGAIQMSKGQWRLSLEMFDALFAECLLHEKMRSRREPHV